MRRINSSTNAILFESLNLKKIDMTDTDCIIRIINAVKARQCLWNVHSQEYAKRDRLEKAWQEVAHEVNKTDVFCREKWRNVRTGFLRSVQGNLRVMNANDEGSTDLLKARRKRFYLYDEMKFLLPSAETLEQSRKRRKYSRSASGQPFASVLNETEYNENTSTMPEWKQDTDAEKYEVTEDETLQEYSKGSNEDDNYTDILKEIAQPIHAPQLQPIEAASNKHHLTQSTAESTPQLASLAATNFSHCSFPEGDGAANNSRNEQQLLDFFRSNIDDVLSLSRQNQRLFKRRLLQLIDELHESERVAKH